MSRIITVHGRVIGLNSRRGLGRLIVEVWDKDFSSKHFAGRTISNSDGSYMLQFDQEYFTKTYRDTNPDLYFMVYDGDDLVKSTEKDVIWNIEKNELEANLEVEEDNLAAAQKNYTFEGTVTHLDGSPLGGLTVLLYEVYTGGRQLVAGTATTHDGFYSLKITGLQLRPGQIPVIQLEVTDTPEKVLGTSPLLSNLQKINQVPFSVDAGLPFVPLYTRHLNSLAPVLGDLDPQHLEREEVQQNLEYLTLVSGRSTTEIEQIVTAQELAEQTGIAPEIILALLGQGLETLADMLSQSDENIGAMLQKAVEEKAIDENALNSLEDICHQLNDVLFKQIINEKSSLGKLLLQVVDENELAMLLALDRSLRFNSEEVWDSLESAVGLQKAAMLQKTLNLNALSGQQYEITLALMELVGEGKQYPTIKSLARMDSAAWEKLINEVSMAHGMLCASATIAGATDEERKTAYANYLADSLRAACPTEAFRGDVERDMEQDSPLAAAKDNLLTFFDNNPDFDFRSHRTYTLRLTETPYSFAGLSDKQDTVETLTKVGRLFNITDNYDAISAHLLRGEDSAYTIAQISQERFLQTYQEVYGSSDAALKAYATAEHISAIALQTVMELSGSLKISPYVMDTDIIAAEETAASSDYAPASMRLSAAADPDLRSMFGSLEQAEVEECQTVHSPAAYLVDILHFLQNRTNEDQSVYNELKRRRGDIMNIDLTGDNTFTPLPYVDLAIERMERLIRNRTDSSQALSESYQTTGTAQELAAGPEHIDEEVYKTLQKALYPAALPLHLPLEEIRTYYSHLGKKRAELLRVFKAQNYKAPADGEPQDYNWALEYLGLSREEAAIIIGNRTNTALDAYNVWQLFGFAGENSFSIPDPANPATNITYQTSSQPPGNWLDILKGRVDIFLQQSGLSYIELLYLLNTRFINNINPFNELDPDNINNDREIWIISTDPNKADTHVLKDLCLDSPNLDDMQKIAKFIRLWRKLGWKAYELDRVICTLGIALDDKADLVKLAYAIQTADLLRIPLQKLLAFWSNIDTTTYAEYDNNPKTAVPSLYERLFLNKTIYAARTSGEALLNKFRNFALGQAEPLDYPMQEALAAAMQSTVENLLALVEALGILSENTQLTPDSLALLYRHVLLQKALNLPAEDYIALYGLLAEDPFAGPEQLNDFMEKSDMLKASGLSIREADYLLRNQVRDEAAESLDREERLYFQAEWREKVQETIDVIKSAAELAATAAVSEAEAANAVTAEAEAVAEVTNTADAAATAMQTAADKKAEAETAVTVAADKQKAADEAAKEVIAAEEAKVTADNAATSAEATVAKAQAEADNVDNAANKITLAAIAAAIAQQGVEKAVDAATAAENAVGTKEAAAAVTAAKEQLIVLAEMAATTALATADAAQEAAQTAMAKATAAAENKAAAAQMAANKAVDAAVEAEAAVDTDKAIAAAAEVTAKAKAAAEAIAEAAVAAVDAENAAIQAKADTAAKVAEAKRKAKAAAAAATEAANQAAAAALAAQTAASEAETANTAASSAKRAARNAEAEARIATDAADAAATAAEVAEAAAAAATEAAEAAVAAQEIQDNLTLQLFAQRYDLSLAYIGKLLPAAQAAICWQKTLENAELADEAEIGEFNGEFNIEEDAATLILLLDKAVWLLKKWRISEEEMGFLLDYGYRYGFLNVALLPTCPTPAANIKGFFRLYKIIKARNIMPAGVAFELLELVSELEIIEIAPSAPVDPGDPVDFVDERDFGIVLGNNSAGRGGIGRDIIINPEKVVDTLDNMTTDGFMSQIETWRMPEQFIKTPWLRWVCDPRANKIIVKYEGRLDAVLKLNTLPVTIVQNPFVTQESIDIQAGLLYQIQKNMLQHLLGDLDNIANGDTSLDYSIIQQDAEFVQVFEEVMDSLYSQLDKQFDHQLEGSMLRQMQVQLDKQLKVGPPQSQIQRQNLLQEKEKPGISEQAAGMQNVREYFEFQLHDQVQNQFKTIKTELKEQIKSFPRDQVKNMTVEDLRVILGSTLDQQFKRLTDHLTKDRKVAQNICVYTAAKTAWLELMASATQSGAAAQDLLGESTDGYIMANQELGILKVKFPRDFFDVDLLLRTLECINSVKFLGLPVNTVSSTLQNELDFTVSGAVRNALKAKYDEDQWYNLIKPLRDPLREKQREALVAYLVVRPDISRHQIWKNANEIYEYLLLDVEMKPITMTSRLKLAISSVQLYVDRVLMGLECTNMNKTQPLRLDAKQVKEWNEWRKLYRVWEANRKIFLYPENWLEPELRDDKTPFFKELESALQQDDVDKDVVEDALRAYLQKLDSVARLEIKGMCHEIDAAAGIDIWHVLGRTYSSPHQYYYRKRVGDEWLAWEKVDTAIDSDHVTIRLWKNRLFMFWLDLTEKQQTNTVSQATSRRCWAIKVAWSEYKQNSWTPKRVSKESLLTDFVENNLDQKKNTSYLLINEHEGALYLAVLNSDNNNQKYFIMQNPNDETQIPCSLTHKYYFSNINNTQPHNMTFEFNSDVANSVIQKLKYSFAYSNTSTTNNNRTIFTDCPGKKLFNIVIPGNNHWSYSGLTFYPIKIMDDGFVYQDGVNTFFVKHSEDTVNGYYVYDAQVGGQVIPVFSVVPWDIHCFKFQTFYHAHVDEFIKRLNLGGIVKLLDRQTQCSNDTMNFAGVYKPNEIIGPYDFLSWTDVYTKDNNKCRVKPYPTNEIDFTFSGSYTIYNWELFFHIPLYIATKLSNNQQFEEARRWFHFIFDPTSGEQGGAERFWQFMPFYDKAGQSIETIDDILRSINEETNSEQVSKWQQNPFKPHVIARIRILAYMKNVVMKYIDNLLAWADQLFRRDTIESINEATNLYILAAKILGERPQTVPLRAAATTQTYQSLSEPVADQENLDVFSNAMVAIEAFITPSGSPTGNTTDLEMPYFLLSKNEQLLQYWDIVADRLFKIRHSMNIEGIERLLPLFEPPIDPGLLVKAAAAGLNLSDVLGGLYNALPNYRFNIMLQKANELCADVKALGGAFLAALEKKDAEQLALIRQSHEIKVLESMRYVKDSQIKELEENLEALHKTKEAAELRFDYYSSRPFMNIKEQAHVDSIKSGLVLQLAQSGLDLAASVAAMVPEVKIGAFTTIGASYGGSNVSTFLKYAGTAIGIAANINNTNGTLASIQGGYERRMDDWKFQAQSAAKDIEQIEKQILANEIRLAIANRELAIHDTQTENAREIDDFMSDKFTNKQLYDWMTGQLSTVYFQSYQLAYDLAKQAQKCYEYELGIEGASFIDFGYWDGLKKGLLAGENLQYDLRRLETAYMQENKRDLELTKHISLALIAPGALLNLKRQGSCEVAIPEALFDLDYPGHYFRRIKSVSLTIPCVTGPYTTVNCTLRLKNSKTRINVPQTYSYDGDSQYRESFSIQTIACSSAQNDSGLFELNFRDERYLPFEGCGAISNWSLELTEEATLRQFDYETISDVILHIKYTAREDGALKARVISNLTDILADLPNERVFSLRQEFPTQWHRFLQSADSAETALLELPLTPEMFPFFAKDKTIEVGGLGIFVKCQQAQVLEVNISPLMNENQRFEVRAPGPFNGWLEGSTTATFTLNGEPWLLSLPAAALEAEIEDIYLALNYNLSKTV